MFAEIKDGNLIITLPVNRIPTPSKSGNSRIVATSGGNKPTSVIVDGQPVTIGVNAYISNK